MKYTALLHYSQTQARYVFADLILFPSHIGKYALVVVVRCAEDDTIRAVAGVEIQAAAGGGQYLVSHCFASHSLFTNNRD